jgi:hypothetical protein
VSARAAHARLIGLMVLIALATLSVYLYSPWHRQPGQGRHACPFFQVEQATGVEASAQVSLEPPLISHRRLSEDETSLAAVAPWQQHGGRAPPA